jgi:hypothetical protein
VTRPLSKIGPQGEHEVQSVQRSDQVPAGSAVLTRPELRLLVRNLERIQEHFKRVHEAQGRPG